MPFCFNFSICHFGHIIKKQWIFLYFLFACFYADAQALKTENVILITFDGLRWQEVFSGADKKLLNSKKYTPDSEALQVQFWHQNPLERRKLLMPFFWSTLNSEGQLIGNRKYGNKVNLTTKHWISYAGYSELLSGWADPLIAHNHKINNSNVTVLEWANQQPEYAGKVAIVGSWNLFPYIINTERSGIPVNSGNMPATGDNLTPKEQELNALLSQTKPRWQPVRQDTLTFSYAMEYLKREQPRLLHLAFGETDEHAHEGNYSEYLQIIHQSDRMIGELWKWLQSQEQYRNKTTLIIATDHGRGHLDKRSWKKHGRPWYPGSNHTFVAILGPDTPPIGEVKVKKKYYQYQVAATIAHFMGLDFKPHQAPGSSVISKP